jgi:hypothetical protein
VNGKPVVPEEAVEAAARAWLERSTKPGSWTLEGSMRAALEAAAPFIAAKALEEAADAWQVRMDTIGRGSVEAKVFMQVRAAAVRGRE